MGLDVYNKTPGVDILSRYYGRWEKIKLKMWEKIRYNRLFSCYKLRPTRCVYVRREK